MKFESAHDFADHVAQRRLGLPGLDRDVELAEQEDQQPVLRVDQRMIGFEGRFPMDVDVRGLRVSPCAAMRPSRPRACAAP